MFKKLLISFFLVITFFLSLAPLSQVRAQSWYSQTLPDWYLKVYDEKTSPGDQIFGERYTAAQVEWVIYGLVSYVLNAPYTLFFGVTPAPNICIMQLANKTFTASDCIASISTMLTDIEKKIQITSVLPPSNIAQSNQTNSSVWKDVFYSDRPLSGISYTRNILKKLSFAPTVHAATTPSFGFNNLLPISDLWGTSRNVAYFLFVIAIIVIAFMIMFKVKISPQAVVTIQSALPKIIISLILVTFSLAIAGLFVDLIYIILGLFSVLMSNGITTTLSGPSAIYNFVSGNLVPGSEGLIVVIGYSLAYIVGYIIIATLISIYALSTANFASALFSFILILFSIILLIILIINIFKSIFELFKALAGVYISVIIAPLQIALGALPAQRGSAFGNWLKGLISKLAVFPATGILYFLSFLFLLKSGLVLLQGILNINGVARKIVLDLLQNESSLFQKLGMDQKIADFFSGVWAMGILDKIFPGNLWGPPLLGNATTASAVAFLLISVMCIMAIPKVSKAITTALAGRPFDLESEIGQPIKTVIGTTGGVVEGFTKGTPFEGTGKVVGSVLQGVTRV